MLEVIAAYPRRYLGAVLGPNPRQPRPRPVTIPPPGHRRGCYLATLRLDNGKRRKIHVVVPTMLNVASFMSEFLCLTVISDEMSSTLSVEWTEQTTRGTIVPFLQCHKTSSHLISPHQLCTANMQSYNQICNLVSCCNHLRLWRTNGPNLAA